MRSATTLSLVLAIAGSCDVAGEAEPSPSHGAVEAPEPSAPDVAEPWTPIAERKLSHGRLILGREPEGRGILAIAVGDDAPMKIECDDRLEGAWGLWVDDVDGDGNAEAIVALHKRARFDDRLANRLHVYSFERDRCVPAWRGTRLAGRFDGVATDADDRGALLVHEWLSPTRRRVARYRWHGFGYRVESVRWEGGETPPAHLIAPLDFGPAPVGEPHRRAPTENKPD